MSELSCASVSKRVLVQNLSYENEFDWHVIEAEANTFPRERFCTESRFDTEAKGNSCYQLHWLPTVIVHTTLEKFESAASFLRFGLPSTLIRHENGGFRKRSSNRRNVKTPALRFRVDRKHFDN